MPSVSAKNRLTVLVLGVGGNVSHGILKALALSDLRPRVVGACVSPFSIGLYTVDRAYVSPLARDPGFLDWLLDTCEREDVAAVLSGVEPVLEVLSDNADLILRRTGAIPLVSPPEVLAIGHDKLRTSRWLSERGFAAPRSAEASDPVGLEELVSACGFPLIAKPRAGKSGEGILMVERRSDLPYIQARKGYVVQEYLVDPGREYTVGCLVDREGQVRGALAMHRDLREGTTVRGSVGEYPEIRRYASDIATALQPTGPINVQLRMSDGHPVCFELNVRFSGTTPARARLGFNEVEAAIRHFVLGEDARDLPIVTSGLMLRYWNELYVDEEPSGALSNGGLIEPMAHPPTVEDYGLRR